MNFSNAKLEKAVLHYVGNKGKDGSLNLSEKMLVPDEDLQVKLVSHYLNRFSDIAERFHFSHPSALKFNETYNFVGDIFSRPEDFLLLSQEIANHLFEKTTHPNSNPGELHVCYFSECIYNNRATDAIGIFKTEVKQGFLEISNAKKNVNLIYREGIPLTKFEKGAILFNLKKKDGFEGCVIDNQNRGEEARYWIDEFLGMEQTTNEFSQTNQLLTVTRNYITQQFSDDFQTTKPDQIELLNRSLDYFKTHETFDKKEFESDVFYHPEMIKSFRKYESDFGKANDIVFEDSFDISNQAVKKQSRSFKSVLKLDNNFHIYIHGDKELIEKGTEKDGRKFYKIYYDLEK